MKNKHPALSKFYVRCWSGPAEQSKAQTEEYMRPVPPGGHDKSPSQSRRLSSRMLSDPEGAATNLPKGHTSSSTLTLSLLTPYSLQSSLPRSQEVRIVHGERPRSTFQPLICTRTSSAIPNVRSFQQPVLRPDTSEFRKRCEIDARQAP